MNQSLFPKDGPLSLDDSGGSQTAALSAVGSSAESFVFGNEEEDLRDFFSRDSSLSSVWDYVVDGGSWSDPSMADLEPSEEKIPFCVVRRTCSSVQRVLEGDLTIGRTRTCFSAC